MRPQRMWLSRQRDGSYMLTKLKPIPKKVRGTVVRDLYMRPGEPVGMRHLCADGVLMMLGVHLTKLDSVRVVVGLELA